MYFGFSLSVELVKLFFLVGYDRKYLVIILSIGLSIVSSLLHVRIKNATKIKIQKILENNHFKKIFY